MIYSTLTYLTIQRLIHTNNCETLKLIDVDETCKIIYLSVTNLGLSCFITPKEQIFECRESLFS